MPSPGGFLFLLPCGYLGDGSLLSGLGSNITLQGPPYLQYNLGHALSLFPAVGISHVSHCFVICLFAIDYPQNVKSMTFLTGSLLYPQNLLVGSTYRASFVAQSVKNLAVQESQAGSLGWEDHLEKEMATYSSILAWKIRWTEEPGGLQSMGSQRVGQD